MSAAGGGVDGGADGGAASGAVRSLALAALSPSPLRASFPSPFQSLAVPWPAVAAGWRGGCACDAVPAASMGTRRRVSLNWAMLAGLLSKEGGRRNGCFGRNSTFWNCV